MLMLVEAILSIPLNAVLHSRKNSAGLFVVLSGLVTTREVAIELLLSSSLMHVTCTPSSATFAHTRVLEKRIVCDRNLHEHST